MNKEDIRRILKKQGKKTSSWDERQREEDKGWDEREESIYHPPELVKKLKVRAEQKKKTRQLIAQRKKKREEEDKEKTVYEKAFPGIYHARKKREARSEYFPQTGKRADEEKGLLSRFYDSTYGKYKKEQENKDRIKKETKAAMAAEPDPFVKKEIARKGHELYQKFEASDVQKEEDREASDTETLAILREREEERKAKEKEARRQEYKSFIDESRLDAKERYGRGERPPRERTNTLDELGAESFADLRDKRMAQDAERRKLDFMTGAEKEEYGVEGKGQLPPSVRARLEDPERSGESMDFLDSRIAGRGHWRGSKEELGGKSIPFTEKMKEEMGGKRIEHPLEAFKRKDPSRGNITNEELLAQGKGGRSIPTPFRPDIMRDGKMDWRGKEKELGGESIPYELENFYTPEMQAEAEGADENLIRRGQPMNQDKAREAISSLDEEEADAVAEEIKANKGVGPEYVDAKEAMLDKDGQQRYVEYQGSGLVINMAVLQKDIDRNRNMKMLQHIPVANRPAMLAAWGYIDPGDLTIAQKQSVKEVKELEVLTLRADKLRLEAEKLKTGLTPENELKYKEAMTGFRQATKDKDWDTATLYASQMRAMGMELSEFDPVALQAASDEKLLGNHPPLLAIAKKHGIMVGGKPSLTPFYKQQGALSLKLSFLGKDAKAAGAGLAESLDIQKGPHTGTKVTFGEILQREGIETWDQVKVRIDAGGNDPISIALAKSMGAENLTDISKEAYLHYAKNKAHDAISRTVWGPAYDEIKQGRLQGRAGKQTNLEKSFDPNRKGDPSFHTTPGGKKFLSYADKLSKKDYVGEPDPGLGKMAKKAEKQAKVAKKEAKKKRIVATAEKAKVKEAKDHEKEITLYNSTVGKGRGTRQKTNAEKKADFMKDGTKRLDALVRGVTIKNKKRGLSGHPKFDSKEEAIKYYKTDPKGKNALKKMSLAFRHFIRNS